MNNDSECIWQKKNEVLTNNVKRMKWLFNSVRRATRLLNNFSWWPDRARRDVLDRLDNSTTTCCVP